MDYDVIFIGAGIAGLIAALEQVSNKQKVLLLEQHNISGGQLSSFVRGRFEFDTAFFPFGSYGSAYNIGDLQELFKKLGIASNIEMAESNEFLRVISTDQDYVDYTLPVGIENYIDKMEEHVPGSRNSMVIFFDLAREIKEAVNYLSANNYKVNFKILKKRFGNFVRVASYNVKDVLYAQRILTAYWIYLGLPNSLMSFVQFALTMLSYVEYGPVMAKNSSYDISLTLEEQLRKSGGIIKHNAKVANILISDGAVSGVKLTNNRIYKARKIVSNVALSKVSEEMLEVSQSPIVSEVPVQAINVYLGLNRSKEELGIKDFQSVIYHNLDNEVEYEKMHSLDNDTIVVLCPNKINPTCSPSGTTILDISSLYFGQCFGENLTSQEYYNLKDQLALKLIDRYEEVTGIKIKDYIEEIEVATPVTYAHYTSSYDGTIYNNPTDYDTFLKNLLNRNGDVLGLYYCGGDSSLGSGYLGAFFSGDEVSWIIPQEEGVNSNAQD